MRRVLFVSLLTVAGVGCLKLDPFLFAANTSDTDELDAGSPFPEEEVTPERIERYRVTVNDEVECSAVRVLANVAPSLGQVYYFPGQGGKLDDAFPRIKRLANLGFDVFALNYRGYGTSTDVTPTEQGIHEDTVAGLAFLRALLPPDTKVGYYGRSLGTAVAVNMAVTDAPDALILESPFASLEVMKTDSSGMDFPIGYIADARFDTEHNIRNVYAPLLILHGELDDYVRHEFGERVYRAANDPKRLVLVVGGNHRNVPQAMREQYGIDVQRHFAGLTEGWRTEEP